MRSAEEGKEEARLNGLSAERSMSRAAIPYCPVAGYT